MEKTRKDVCVPRHVAIIMDGNNRWAKKRLLPGVAGHKAGVDAVRAVIEVCAEAGVEVLTLFAFSSENWQRPADEVSALMELFLVALRREVRKLDENGIRLRIIGDRTRFHPELQAAMREAEAATAGNTRFLLQVAANYGGQWDIVQAAQRLAREVQGGHLAADDISAELLQGCLVTGDQPLPDLCIRTGGEHRISNFFSGSWPTPSCISPTCSGPTSSTRRCGLPWRISPSASAASARPASKSRPRPVRHAETTDHHGAGAFAHCAGWFFLLEGAFFALFIGAVVSLGAWEWARLAGYEQQFGRVAYAATVAVLMVALYHLPQLAGAVLLLALVWWTLATVLVLTYPESVGYWPLAPPGHGPADPVAGLAGAGPAQAVAAGQWPDHRRDGAGLGRGYRRLLLRQGLRQAQAGAAGQPRQELGRRLRRPGGQPGDHPGGRPLPRLVPRRAVPGPARCGAGGVRLDRRRPHRKHVQAPVRNQGQQQPAARPRWRAGSHRQPDGSHPGVRGPALGRRLGAP